MCKQTTNGTHIGPHSDPTYKQLRDPSPICNGGDPQALLSRTIHKDLHMLGINLTQTDPTSNN